MTALEASASQSLFYNPAGMARLNSGFHAAVAHTRWIGDVDYNAARFAFQHSGGIYGVFRVSIMAVDYGEMVGTIRADNDQGYLDCSEIGLGNPSPTSLSVGFGYARALTDRFAVGAQ